MTDERVAERTTRRLRERVEAALAARLSPAGIRRATLTERLTVRLLSWEWHVRFNRWLALLGKLATCVWVAFIASVVLGFDWKDAVESVFNHGNKIEHAFALALLVPTLIFLVARSALGFCRWRLQRELWRRDVERLSR